MSQANKKQKVDAVAELQKHWEALGAAGFIRIERQVLENWSDLAFAVDEGGQLTVESKLYFKDGDIFGKTRTFRVLQ